MRGEKKLMCQCKSFPDTGRPENLLRGGILGLTRRRKKPTDEQETQRSCRATTQTHNGPLLQVSDFELFKVQAVLTGRRAEMRGGGPPRSTSWCCC